MPKVTEQDRLTQAERLALYYVAPRVAGPLTVALLAAYGVVFLEALLFCAYGLWRGESPWPLAGVGALGGAVALGVVIFVGRAVFVEVRFRRALRTARREESAWDGMELGDPFEGRRLLCRPARSAEDVYGCATNEGEILYYVSRDHGRWQVRDARDAPALEVVEEKGPPSFALFLQGRAEPRQVRVFRDGRPVALIRRRPGIYGTTARIQPLDTPGPALVVAGGGIYQGGRLVGRVYRLRSQLYLDIEDEMLGDGLLGWFLTLQ
ncbi:MAG: hypothetical protein KBH78_01855 [Candidatus Hydrogenedentes bacterium]|nr:hypothetical protein [Candidatus Hydrogenedentota bacterium]